MMTNRFSPVSSLAFSNLRPSALALIALLVTPLAGCAAGSASVASTGYVLTPADQRLIEALPAPQLSGVDVSGSCRNTELSFENQRAQARWPAPGYIMPLQHWAMHHAGSRAATSAPRCADNELSIKLWQSAIGTPATGRLSERDADEFVRLVDARDTRYAKAAERRRISPPDAQAVQKRQLEQAKEEQRRSQEEASLRQLCETEGARIEYELQTLPQRGRQAVIQAANANDGFAVYDISRRESLLRSDLEKKKQQLESQCGSFYPRHIERAHQQQELNRKRMEYQEYFNKVR